MNRKDNTVKQLQAECKKRGIGFMTTWTKLALTKRLEDEDKKDKEIEILKSKSKKDQQLVKKVQKDLKKLDKKVIEQAAIDSLRKQKLKHLLTLENRFTQLHTEQEVLLKKSSIIAHEKAKINSDIESVKILIKSLK